MAKREGFTLIEVMISVLIISTVVMALYTMNGNSSFIYTKSVKEMESNGYLSFLVANKKYGFESDSLDMDRLLEGYDLEDALRQKLKAIKLKIAYDELYTLDMSEFDVKEDAPDAYQEDKKEKNQASMVFEIGKTSLVFEQKSNASVLRLRVP
ncbi:MAG: prepilin-type N-terminal cleavage/methylation domain-containing protein [Sulfurimonas sp.]|jgi:prepilin-type N-terminal cleavage/methylation domain-containing protein|nr:prepilin-type N-terminal cleavage/methylation domain-containing protein [Sulfurimonas sp.]